MGDCINGKGKKVFANGDIYEGNFKNGKLDGFGIFISAIKDSKGVEISAKIYEGEWRNNKKEGKGKLTVHKNDKSKIYSGQFVNGKLNGEGKIETNSEKYIGKLKK